MPIRITSFSKRIAKAGKKLHQAKLTRVHALGADHEPSQAEQALAEERRQLKEERAKRKEQALLPGPTALDKLVRTRHPEAKAKVKAPKEAKEPKEAKAAKGGKPAKAGPSRAEKSAAKDSALDAARRSKSKSAKT